MIMITLDREREIKFTIRAMREVESQLKKPYRVALLSPGVTEMHVLLWAGLRHEDRKLSLDQVEKLMDDWLATDPMLKKLDNLLYQALVESGFFVSTDEEGADIPEAKTGGG
jgi:hypothetical protein